MGFTLLIHEPELTFADLVGMGNLFQPGVSV